VGVEVARDRRLILGKKLYILGAKDAKKYNSKSLSSSSLSFPQVQHGVSPLFLVLYSKMLL
jgi:hypothetical protein